MDLFLSKDRLDKKVRMTAGCIYFEKEYMRFGHSETNAYSRTASPYQKAVL